MRIRIIKADERHRSDINRLIKDAKIGSPLSRKDFAGEDFWAARINGKIVACAGLDFHGRDTAILTTLVVEKELRHQGIGSALIQKRLAVARERGAKIAALVTMYYWFRFYKKRGFRTCPRAGLPAVIKDYWMFTTPRYKKCAVMYQRL